MTTPSPASEVAATRAKLRRELSIFFIGLGLLLAIAAYFTLTGISRGVPPMWGLPRYLATGVPLAVLSVLHLAAGALLTIHGSPFFCVTGAIASTLVTVFFFAFILTATGRFPVNLFSVIVAAIPIAVWTQAAKFLSASAQTSSGGES